MTTFFKLMLAYHREKAFREGRYLSSSSLPWPERYRRKPLMRWSPRDRTLFKIADRDLNYKNLVNIPGQKWKWLYLFLEGVF